MKNIIIIICITIINAISSFSQVGTIDSNFNLGTGFGPDQWSGKCETITQQADGKLLVGGHFKTFNNNPTLYISRLNLDGTLDNTFVSPFNDNWGAEVRQIKVLSNGKILVCGVFLKSNNINLPGIVRLNSNGTLDNSFNVPSTITACSTFDVQNDGKIVLGNLIRLEENGTIDNTFNTGNGISGGSGFGSVRVNKLRIQPDGKILIGGHFGFYNGNSAILLARINSDGSLDNTFNANANFAKAVDGFYGQVYDINIFPNSKILIGGNYGNSNSLAFGVDKLNNNGTLDTSFDITHAFSIRNYVLAIQPNEKILAANVNFGAPNEAFVVERYNTNGSLDATFPKRFVNSDVKDLIVQEDGKITFVGYFNYNPTGIMRLIGDSSLSTDNIDKQILDVYPNPANHFINISNFETNAILRIYDFFGRIILSQKTSTKSLYKLNISNLSSGTYFLQIEKEGKFIMKKFVVTK